MTTRKNYNSIVFLTTLSVYLGLVLVGAPATVLAQAALTGRLEVKDKIEKRDDLDKKPDDVADEKVQSLESGNRVILDYAEVVKVLFEASWQADTKRFTYECEAKSDYAGKLQAKRFFFTNFEQNEPNTRQIFHTTHSVLFKLFSLFPVKTSYDESNVIVSFKLSDKGFTTESKFLQKDGSDTQELLSAYNASLERLKREIVNKRQALILKHTEVLTENNQFVIVTRLPRGSLDTLLAKKDSAK
jgi:hypothetical protein